MRENNEGFRSKETSVAALESERVDIIGRFEQLINAAREFVIPSGEK